MTDNVCPPLGTGSVDFNALHDAAARGENLVEALEAATTRVEPITEETIASLPTLGGKTRKQLEAVAASEGVTITDEMKLNQDVVDAIEAHRDALLNPPADDAASDAEDPDSGSAE